MTKQVEFDWRVPVASQLVAGDVFDRWVESKESAVVESDCRFGVDEDGFFLHWRGEKNEGSAEDLCLVKEIRTGKRPKDPDLVGALVKKHGALFQEKSLNLVLGTDLSTSSNYNIVCRDEAAAVVPNLLAHMEDYMPNIWLT